MINSTLQQQIAKTLKVISQKNVTTVKVTSAKNVAALKSTYLNALNKYIMEINGDDYSPIKDMIIGKNGEFEFILTKNYHHYVSRKLNKIVDFAYKNTNCHSNRNGLAMIGHGKHIRHLEAQGLNVAPIMKKAVVGTTVNVTIKLTSEIALLNMMNNMINR